METAIREPALFLRIHPAPLIIDEVQYAPNLFEYIESIVDSERMTNGDCRGLYVLACSQIYSLMENVTQSMAGRAPVIKMQPLSMSEIFGRAEIPFESDLDRIAERSKKAAIPVGGLYEMIVRGSFPELYDKPDYRTNRYYSNYLDTYIERDVSQIVNLKDKLKFKQFMEYVASLTRQELVYDRISKSLGINIKTIQSWIGILASGGLIRLVEPYCERSNRKRIVKHPKIYFTDTELACYLAKIFDSESLRVGYLNGPMVETFIVNEIIKSYENNTEDAGFFYYRDSQMNEIDLIIQKNGSLTLIECKAGMTYDETDVKSFRRMEDSDYRINVSFLICLTEKIYLSKMASTPYR